MLRIRLRVSNIRLPEVVANGIPSWTSSLVGSDPIIAILCGVAYNGHSAAILLGAESTTMLNNPLVDIRADEGTEIHRVEGFSGAIRGYAVYGEDVVGRVELNLVGK